MAPSANQSFFQKPLMLFPFFRVEGYLEFSVVFRDVHFSGSMALQKETHSRICRMLLRWLN